MVTSSQTSEPRALRGLFSKLWQHALDLLFPPRCVACAKVGGWFCSDCQASIDYVRQPICPLCGYPSPGDEKLCRRCQTQALQLDGLRSVAFHDKALRQAIHHLKYRQRTELARPLGQMLARYWQDVGLQADLIVPVPLHPARRQERGYNQAALLARELGRLVERPVDEGQLVRVRATAPQVELDADERRNNVAGAFAWRGPALDSGQVVLVDDVCTTGSTLQASAVALRQANVGPVWALTLARAR